MSEHCTQAQIDEMKLILESYESPESTPGLFSFCDEGQFMSVVAKLFAEVENDRWIDVKERSPETSGTVRAWSDWNDEEVKAKLLSGVWKWEQLNCCDRFEWMKMPKPPTHWRPLAKGPSA